MAPEDIDVKYVVIYYLIPFFGALLSLWFVMKKMKSIKLMTMAWVANKVLKKLHKKLQKEKDKTFSELRRQGSMSHRNLKILEIGSGSGMNFKYFPKGAEIVCLDPNPYNEKYVQENMHEINPDVRLRKFVVGFAENMPSIEDNSCDAVVCTLVLCTVRDMQAVLSEVKRILKPNGIFYFVEHVASNQGTFKRRVQNFLNPLWNAMCDGCNLNRETWRTLRSTGFSKCDITHFTCTTFKLSTPCIYGMAVK